MKRLPSKSCSNMTGRFSWNCPVSTGISEAYWKMTWIIRGVLFGKLPECSWIQVQKLYNYLIYIFISEVHKIIPFRRVSRFFLFQELWLIPIASRLLLWTVGWFRKSWKSHHSERLASISLSREKHQVRFYIIHPISIFWYIYVQLTICWNLMAGYAKTNQQWNLSQYLYLYIYPLFPSWVFPFPQDLLIRYLGGLVRYEQINCSPLISLYHNLIW